MSGQTAVLDLQIVRIQTEAQMRGILFSANHRSYYWSRNNFIDFVYKHWSCFKHMQKNKKTKIHFPQLVHCQVIFTNCCQLWLHVSAEISHYWVNYRFFFFWFQTHWTIRV